MRGSLVLGCAVGAFYTMAVILPFVLMEKIGLTPTQFGLVMLAQTGFYALGAAVTGRLLRRIEVMRLVPIGLMLIAVSAMGFGVGLRLLPLSVYTAMGPVVIWAFGAALVIPGATTGALAGFPKVAGAASALGAHRRAAARSAGNRRGSLRHRLTDHHQPTADRPLVRDRRQPDAGRRHPRSDHPQRAPDRAAGRKPAQAARRRMKCRPRTGRTPLRSVM